MMSYHSLKHYQEVPAPEIEATGIAELMRTPADGVNRNDHINWNSARFAVAANIEKDGCPSHQIIVDFSDDNSETGRYTQGMAVDLGQNGLPIAIATVSGGHREGMGRLSDEQRQVMDQLIQRSIDAGEVQF